MSPNINKYRYQSVTFDDVWNAHVVDYTDAQDLVFIDRILLHEVNSAFAFSRLAELQVEPFDSNRITAYEDHNTPTIYDMSSTDLGGRRQRYELKRNCDRYGIKIHSLGDSTQGIVHVAAPENGDIFPGDVVACCDSHTTTLGAFGCIPLGIGSTQIAEAMISQSIWIKKPDRLSVRLRGHLDPSVSVKDLALYMLSRFGSKFATGKYLDFTGESLAELSMAERATLCNMALEMGARSAWCSIDQTTINFYENRKMIVDLARLEHYLKRRRDFETGEDIFIDLGAVLPMMTWGTSPEHASVLDDNVPLRLEQPYTGPGEAEAARALRYMGLRPGQRLSGVSITDVFIGSCTNARYEDILEVAEILSGRQVSPDVHTLIVPGSSSVYRALENDGIVSILREAGADVRSLPGCSLCCGLNSDRLEGERRVVSTTNRNFEGRQGDGVRTHLASPRVAAVAALLGRIPTVKEFSELCMRE